MLKKQGLYGGAFSADKFRVWLSAMLTGKAPNGNTLRAKSKKYGIDFHRVGAHEIWACLAPHRVVVGFRSHPNEPAVNTALRGHTGGRRDADHGGGCAHRCRSSAWG